MQFERAKRPVSASSIRPQRQHGSKPVPAPSRFSAGCGEFRNFEQDSKYLVEDPLKYEGPQAQDNFSLGFPSGTTPHGGNFRTLDISKINEKRYKWNRLDTFQTPMGHVGDIEDALAPHPIVNEGSGCGFQPMLLQALEADLFEEFHSCLETLASHVIGGFREELQNFHGDMAESLEQIRRDLQSAKGGLVVAGAGSVGTAASSHEAHRAEFCTSAADVDMGRRVIEEVRAGSLAVLESLKEIRSQGLGEGNVSAWQSSVLCGIKDSTALLSEKLEQMKAENSVSGTNVAGNTASLGTDLSHLTASLGISLLGEMRKHENNTLAAIKDVGQHQEERMEFLMSGMRQSPEVCCADAPAEGPDGPAAMEEHPRDMQRADWHASSGEARPSNVSDNKFVMSELRKIACVLDGISDMCSGNLDLSPVLEAVSRLDVQHPQNIDANLKSVVRAIAEVSTSVTEAQQQLTAAGKLPTEDSFRELRQVVVSNLHDLQVNSEQLREKVDSLEERLISRINSNHQVAMSELENRITAGLQPQASSHRPSRRAVYQPQELRQCGEDDENENKKQEGNDKENRKEVTSDDTDFSHVLEAFDKHASCSLRVLEDVHKCVQTISEDASLSKALQAFDAHAATSKAAFADISRTVLMEVRKGWVEVGAVWQQPSSTPCTPAPSPAAHMGNVDLGQSPQAYREERDVDFTVVLDAIRDLAARQCPLSEVVGAVDRVTRDVSMEFADMKLDSPVKAARAASAAAAPAECSPGSGSEMITWSPGSPVTDIFLEKKYVTRGSDAEEQRYVSQASDIPIEEGMTVNIVGLDKNSDLNGCIALCAGFDAKTQRYIIKLMHKQGTVLLKRGNLHPIRIIMVDETGQADDPPAPPLSKSLSSYELDGDSE